MQYRYPPQGLKVGDVITVKLPQRFKSTAYVTKTFTIGGVV